MSLPAERSASGANRIRVASYNVLFGRMGAPEQIGRMFEPYGLDVIAFCEVPGGSWTAEVGKALGMEHCFVGGVS